MVVIDTQRILIFLPKKLSEIDLRDFFNRFNDSMDVAEAELGYGIKCKVQSHKIQPNAQGTFPTVQINIAFAIVLMRLQ